MRIPRKTPFVLFSFDEGRVMVSCGGSDQVSFNELLCKLHAVLGSRYPGQDSASAERPKVTPASILYRWSMLNRAYHCWSGIGGGDMGELCRIFTDWLMEERPL